MFTTMWSPLQISFASAVSTLSDRTRFKNFFRTLSKFDTNAPAILSILNHYGWNQIVFLTQDVNLFNKVLYQTNLHLYTLEHTSLVCMYVCTAWLKSIAIGQMV